MLIDLDVSKFIDNAASIGWEFTQMIRGIQKCLKNSGIYVVGKKDSTEIDITDEVLSKCCCKGIIPDSGFPGLIGNENLIDTYITNKFNDNVYKKELEAEFNSIVEKLTNYM